MRRKITAIIMTIVMTVGMMISPAIVSAADVNYTPVEFGQDLIKNSTYTDIKSSKYADSIIQMTDYTIIRNYGSKTFLPTKAATKDEILAALVRAEGGSAAADTQALTLRATDTSISATNAYMIGHLRQAQTLGILDATESALLTNVTTAERAAIRSDVYKNVVLKNFKMTAAQFQALLNVRIANHAYSKYYKIATSREETAVWVAKAAGLTPIIGDKAMTVYNFKDWKTINSAKLPYVEAAIRAGYMSGSSKTNFYPKQMISRGEMASIIKNVIYDKPDKAGITIGYGAITSLKKIKSLNPQASKNGTEVTIEATDGSKAIVTIDKSTEKTADGRVLVSTLPVLKKGVVGNESLLQKGQFVEYAVNSDSTVQLVTVGKLSQYIGAFQSYNSSTKTVTFKDEDNIVRKLTVNDSSDITSRGTAIPVAKIPTDSKGKVIVEGSLIKSLTFDFDPTMLSSDDIPVTINYIDDTLKILNATDENGVATEYQLADDYIVLINGKEVSSSELSFDTSATIKIRSGKVYEISTTVDLPEEDPYNTLTVKIARVRTSTPSELNVSFSADPNEVSAYTIDTNTVILKGSKPIKATALHRGDRIKVYLNSAQEKYISRVELQTSGQVLKGVYKARIVSASNTNDDITLSDVSKFGYNNWVAQDGQMKFRLNIDSKSYNGNQLIGIDELKDMAGQFVYFATVDDFGSEEIIKLNIKTGTEDILENKKITDVTWTDYKIQLSSGQTFTYQDGSIIVRDGRLLDKYDLEEMGGAWFVLNRTTAGNANLPVISLDGPNGFTNYRIVQGYLHKLGTDYMTIEKPYFLNGTLWQADTSGDFAVQLSNEMWIYDAAIDNKLITKDQLLESRFKPYKYIWPNYAAYITAGGTSEVHVDDAFHNKFLQYNTDPKYHEHCKVYIILDSNNNALGMIINAKDKNLYNPAPKVFNERLMAGKMTSYNAITDNLDMDSVREYLTASSLWNSITATVPLDTTKAMALKDGVPCKLSDIEVGDTLYTLSLDGFATFILAE